MLLNRLILLILAMLTLPSILKAQDASLSGKVTDTASHNSLQYAVASVLRQEDSTLVTYSRTDQDGRFQIKSLPAGKYILLLSYPEYGGYVEKLNLQPGENRNLNTLVLTPKAVLLENIVIGKAAIRIKGDTTIYFADSFHVKANSSVEDLLKVLPGMQVDKNGKITAQGETVQKILVDGDEFFGDDPTVATQNLRADAVKEVQVFDKKSDQAEFTGIDDGQTKKTINLTLKDDAKKGYFGKLSAGALDQYYNGAAMINAFKSKRKFAAFAKTSTTSETGLDFSSAGNYGFDAGGVRVDGGAVTIGGSSGDGLGVGNFGGQGLPESIKAGLHYSNKWVDDKYATNLNYLFNKLDITGRSDVLTQNILKDSVYYQNQHTDNYSSQTQHSFSGRFEFQIDSSSNLRLQTNGLTGPSKNQQNFLTQSLSQENKLVNKSVRNTNSDQDKSQENIDILYRKKFKKKGRTLSIDANQSYRKANSKGYLYNESTFYNLGTPLGKDTTDQYKPTDNLNRVIGASATYTEPLSGRSYLEVNYSFYDNFSTSDKETFNRDFGGKYTDKVDSLSNNYKYIYLTHSAGANYRFNEKKYNFSFGGNVANTSFKQDNLVSGISRNRNYYNFFPRANIMYKFNSFSNIRFSYFGQSSQPTIDQIQPLADNSDPLNILIGNPDLKQQFDHSFQANYSSFKLVSESYMFIRMNAGFTENDISSSYVIDTLGRKISQYINVSGNYNVGIGSFFNTKLKNSSWRIGGGPGYNISSFTNMVNGEENKTKNSRLMLRTTADSRKQDVYDFRFEVTPAYNMSKSSISSSAGTNYWTWTIHSDGDYMLPWKLEIGTDFDWDLRQKTVAFDKNNNSFVWNAYLEKKFMKSDALVLRFSIHDILDQNKGYFRNVSDFSIQESRYLTFRRYGLITLTYNFVNRGGKGPDKGRMFRL